MIEKILNCRKCNLYNNQTPLIDKKNNCDIMWVGLSAKKVKDVKINYPLENDTNSGKLIEEIEMKNSKLNYYKTNLVKCLPLQSNGKIRYPSKHEMNTCMKNLMMEIDELEPKIIFLLGNLVGEFFDEYIIKNNITINSKIVKVEHPSYICVYKRKQKDEYINKITHEIQMEKQKVR